MALKSYPTGFICLVDSMQLLARSEQIRGYPHTFANPTSIMRPLLILSFVGGAASAFGFSSLLFWIIFGGAVALGLFYIWTEKRVLRAAKEIADYWDRETETYSKSDL